MSGWFKSGSFLIALSFLGAFAGALSMADNLADPRAYLKAFVLGLGATGLLHTRLPSEKIAATNGS